MGINFSNRQMLGESGGKKSSDRGSSKKEASVSFPGLKGKQGKTTYIVFHKGRADFSPTPQSGKANYMIAF